MELNIKTSKLTGKNSEAQINLVKDFNLDHTLFFDLTLAKLEE